MIQIDDFDVKQIINEIDKIKKEIATFNHYMGDELCDRHISVVAEIIELEKELLEIYQSILAKMAFTREEIDRCFELSDAIGVLEIKTENYFPCLAASQRRFSISYAILYFTISRKLKNWGDTPIFGISSTISFTNWNTIKKSFQNNPATNHLHSSVFQ